MDYGTATIKCCSELEWALNVVCRGWVQQIWIEFTVCWSKAAVLMGLAAVVPAEGRTPGVTLSHMEEVLIRTVWGVTTILTHKDLGAPLTIGVLLVNTMNLPHMGLQRATLCECFLTQFTLVGTDTCSKGRQKRVLPVHVCVDAGVHSDHFKNINLCIMSTFICHTWSTPCCLYVCIFT